MLGYKSRYLEYSGPVNLSKEESTEGTGKTPLGGFRCWASRRGSSSTSGCRRPKENSGGDRGRVSRRAGRHQPCELDRERRAYGFPWRDLRRGRRAGRFTARAGLARGSATAYGG